MAQAVGGGTDRHREPARHVSRASNYGWGGGNVNSIIEWFTFDPAPGIQTLEDCGAFGRAGTWLFDSSVEQNEGGAPPYQLRLKVLVTTR